MNSIKRVLKSISNWLFSGRHLPIFITVFIIVAVTAIAGAVIHINREDTELVSVYVTVEGIGDEFDFKNKKILIEDSEAVSDIFSLKYPEIYEEFGKPLVQYNEFTYFMGVRKTGSKTFHVTLDNVHCGDLTQAYVYSGQTIKISYY